MKAKLYDKIKLLCDVQADFDHHNRIIYQGQEGIITECYENPECYAVDIAIPNPNLVGSFEYENVILDPEQFMVISHSTKPTSIQTTSP